MNALGIYRQTYWPKRVAELAVVFEEVHVQIITTNRAVKIDTHFQGSKLRFVISTSLV
jgi:hypothetical protein